jgi:F420 biosynthesis protein FbiB-like protein
MSEITIDQREFWSYLDRLVADCPVVIDRPRGSAHPRYSDLVYPLDYGYLDGTTTVDGGGLDLFLGSRAVDLDAVVLTVDLDKRDAEIKLLLGCTETEKQEVINFLNGWTMRAWMVRRGGDLDLLLSRRSVRRFQSQEIPREMLERMLEAATWAPSAHNRQPWRFVVMTSVEARENLAKAMGADFRRDLLADGLPVDQVEAQVQRSRQRIETAPAAVLLCLDGSVGDDYPDSRRQKAEFLMGVQSVALAGGQLLLAAHSLGLAGVWMCAPLFAALAAQRALGLPASWKPQALILLGYPAKIPPPRQRQSPDQVARFL